MPDDPNSLQILIEILARDHGSAAVQAALDKTKVVTKETAEVTGAAAQATEKFTLNNRALREILRIIGYEAGPQAGLAVSAAAAGMTGGILTTVIAIQELFRWIDSLKKQAEEARQTLANIWVEQKDALQAAADAAADYTDEIQKAAKALNSPDFKSAFADQKAILDAQIEGHKKILDAIEQEQLAEAKGDKSKEAAVKSRFADIKREYDLNAEQEQLTLQRQQLAGLKQQQEKLKAIADDQAAEQQRITADQSAAAAAGRIKGKNEDQLKAEVDKQNVGLEQARQRVAEGPGATLGEQAAFSQAQFHIAAAEKAQAALNAYEADAKTVHDHNEAVKRANKAADDAAKAYEDNNKAIKEQSQKVSTDQSVLVQHTRTAAATGLIGGDTGDTARRDALEAMMGSAEKANNVMNGITQHALTRQRVDAQIIAYFQHNTDAMERLHITIKQLQERLSRATQ